MVSLLSILCAFITCVFPSLKNLFPVCSTQARQQLDTSRHKTFLSKFSGFFSIPLDRQPDPSSHISKIPVCLIDISTPPRSIEVFGRRYLLDTFRSIEMPDYIYIYLRFNPVHFSLKYFNLSRPKHPPFLKILLLIKISTSSWPQSFGKWSQSLLFLILHTFHAFQTQVLGFGKIFFCGYAKIFGLGFVELISHEHALHSLAL